MIDSNYRRERQTSILMPDEVLSEYTQRLSMRCAQDWSLGFLISKIVTLRIIMQLDMDRILNLIEGKGGRTSMELSSVLLIVLRFSGDNEDLRKTLEIALQRAGSQVR